MLQFIRKRMLNAYFALPMLICMALTTFSSMGRTTPTKKVNFSGEEIFRGIFFAEGKYADLIPEVSSKKETVNQTQLNSKVNEVISKIKQKDANFFEHYKQAMLSGNYLLTQQAIENGVSMVKGVTALKQSVSDQNKGTCLVVLVNCNTLLDLGIMNDVDVVIVYVICQDQELTMKTKLYQEQLVNSVCKVAKKIS